MIKITEFQLSAIWTETNLRLCDPQAPTTAPMAFMGNSDRFAERFREAQYWLQQREPLPLSTPWKSTKGEHFWTHYMGGAPNASVAANEAWRNLVPLRATLPVEFDDETKAYAPQLDLFFYPFGLAFMATFKWRADEPVGLAEMRDRALSLRHEYTYCVSWPESLPDLFDIDDLPPVPYKKLSLNQLASLALGAARLAAWGEKSGAGISTDPFTLFSVLSGEGVDLDDSPENDPDLWQTLPALTRWQPTPPGAALPDWSRVNVGLGEQAGEADMLYGQRRSRIIWYPTRFTSQNRGLLFGLDCYHHNLANASMQTESVCKFVVELMQRIKQGRELSPVQRGLSRHAAGILGRLYSAQPDTYRSESVRKQIQENNWVEAINGLRQRWNMSALH